jgi:hypothetical protein
MDMSKYGVFASVVAASAALAATFSLVLAKAIGGRVAKWTWMLNNTPPFMVTVGVRALAVALIALTFLLIDKDNYRYFVGISVIYGALVCVLLAYFNHLRQLHTYRVPKLTEDGQAATDRDGRAVEETLVIGKEEDMNEEAKKAFADARAGRGLSLTDFLGGYGGTRTNNPESVWTRSRLSAISNRMFLCVMGVLLCAVMALYTAASAIDVATR